MPPISSDLQLSLELLRARAAGNAYAFQRGPQVYIRRGGVDGVAENQLDWSEQLLDKLAAVCRPGGDSSLEAELGDLLHEFLRPMGWQDYAAKLLLSHRENKQAVVTLLLHAAELYALPWELLKIKGEYLAALRGVLLRYQWPQTDSIPEPGPRPEGGRILFAWSAAGGNVPTAAHLAALNKACLAANFRVDRILEVLPDASAKKLSARLEAASREGRPFAVLHLLCHGRAMGSTYGLALDAEDAPGQAQSVDAAWLRRTLGKHAATLRLLVLCACDSSNSGALGGHLGSLAQEAHRAGVAAVVASRYPLSVVGSNVFADVFYHALLAGPDDQGPVSLENALRVAREKLAEDPVLRDWLSLQLYARQEDGDDSRPIIFRPYRGLEPFGYVHRRFFHGRDPEIREVVDDLQALLEKKKPRLLIVAGASGCGKSSLVQAGAVPVLQSTQAPWEVKVIRPGSEPLRTLEDTLPEPLDPAARVLLIVDQFEEVFTHVADPKQRQQFAQRLWQLANDPAMRTAVILTLRVDFIGHCGELVVDQVTGRGLDKIAYLEEHRVFVARMERAQLHEVITRPAEQVGLQLEPGLAHRMLEDVGSEPGNLPLLEYTLDLLWQQRAGRTLTQAAYEQLGGVAGALHRSADALVQKLSESERREARRLLVQLVRIGDETSLGTRRRRTVDSLRPLDPERATAFSQVMDKLVNARLLVCDSEKEGAPQTVEVAHEALIRKWKTLQEWVEQDRKKLVELLQLEEWAKLWQLYPKSFLIGDQLGYAEVVAKNHPDELSQPVHQLLAASREEERKRREQEETMRQLALEPLVEQGRQELLRGKWMPALLWLHRAYEQGSKASTLPYLLEEAVRPLDAVQATLIGHKDLLNSAQYSPDGCRVVTASHDKTAKIWDALTSKLLHNLEGHQKPVTSAQYSPDGCRIVTASEDRTAKVWDAFTGMLLHNLEGHKYTVWNAQHSPDSSRIVTASSDNTAKVWDALTGMLLHDLKGHQYLVNSAQYSPDGCRIVTASSDNTAKIWDALTGMLLHDLAGHQDVLRSAHYSPDGCRIVTASSDHTAKIWDAITGMLLHDLAGHQDVLRSAHYSPDGCHIVTASSDHTAKIWNALTGMLLHDLEGHQYLVNSAQYSPDGCHIVTASWDHTTKVWDALTGMLLHDLEGHQNTVYSAQYSPNGCHIVTASWDYTAKLWDALTGKTLHDFKGHQGEINSAQYSPDGCRIVTASYDDTVKVWDALTGNLLHDLEGHQNTVYSAQYSPDGCRIVTSSTDRTAKIWDALTGNLLHDLEGHQNTVYSAQYSPDGCRVVTASSDDTAKVWDALTGKLLYDFKGHQNTVCSAQYSPDGYRIVTASTDRTAKVWDALTGNLLHDFEGHQDSINSAQYSPDGFRIVTASEDKTAKVWDAFTGKLLYELEGHQDAVNSAQYSPDGCRTVTASSDRTARVWDASPEKRSPEQLAVLMRRHLPYKLEGSVIVRAHPEGGGREPGPTSR